MLNFLNQFNFFKKIKINRNAKIIICGMIAIISQVAGLNQHAADMLTHMAEIFGMGSLVGDLLAAFIGNL
jgi:hypothetical protein